MTRQPHTMVPGETVLFSTNANLLLSVKENGMTPSFRSLLLGGRFAVGGTLILTNYRLAFSASPLASSLGEFGMTLPRIRAVSNTSRSVLRTIRVDAEPGTFDFVVWGIPALLTAIDAARESFDPADLARIEGYTPEAEPLTPQ